MDPIFYVYMLFRPNGLPCYVGKGKGKRWLKHEWRSHNPHLAAIIKKAGGSLPKIRIREDLTEAEAHALEIVLIKVIGRETAGGPLVNQTDGGEGITGYKHTAEEIEKNAARSRGNQYCLGRVASPETRAKQSAAKLGRRLTEKHREAIGSAHRGKSRPADWGQKISAAKMGHAVSQATRDKISATKRAAKA
jgi:hypothetical protein